MNLAVPNSVDSDEEREEVQSILESPRPVPNTISSVTIGELKSLSFAMEVVSRFGPVSNDVVFGLGGFC